MRNKSHQYSPNIELIPNRAVNEVAQRHKGSSDSFKNSATIQKVSSRSLRSHRRERSARSTKSSRLQQHSAAELVPPSLKNQVENLELAEQLCQDLIDA